MKSKVLAGTSLGVETDSFVVSCSPNSFTYRIFVTNVLEHNDEMINAVCVLEEATDLDTVHLYINTPGGSVDSALMLYNSLLETKAHTVAECSGHVASAGTMILMACDQIKVSPHTVFLFHTSSTGVFGNSSEIKNHSQFHEQWNDSLIRGIYGDFLTEPEYKEMLSYGKDILMSSEQFIERYNSTSKQNEISFDMLKKFSKETLIQLILGEKRLNIETGEIV